MINVDDRILNEADADELFLLLHIAKHMNKDNFAWPSNATLCESTKWEIKKLQRVKARCADKGFIEIVKRFRESGGGMAANGYRVKTDCLTVFVNLSGKGDRIPQNGIGGIPQKRVPPIPQNGIGAGTPKRDRDRSINKNEVLTNERERENARAQEPQVLEVPIDFEPFAPQTANDVVTLIARANLNGDSPDARLKIWEAVEQYLPTRDFKNQWSFLMSGLPGADRVDPADVVREWVTLAPYYDVKEFRINKIKGWIRTAANTLKNGKATNSDEPRYGAAKKADLERAYKELLIEGFK